MCTISFELTVIKYFSEVIIIVKIKSHTMKELYFELLQICHNFTIQSYKGNILIHICIEHLYLILVEYMMIIVRISEVWK